MGVRVVGLRDLELDLDRIKAEAPEKFRKVVARGAVQIKLSWKRRWSPEIGKPPQHLPHVVRGIGYDTKERPTWFYAEIGVHPNNPQAPLAHFAEFGSVNNAPHPGGLPALLEEEPRFVKAVGDVAVELLEGQ